MLYQYSGVNDKGKKVSGNIDAENDKAARVKLRRMNIFPTTLGTGGAGGGGLNKNVDFSKYFQKVKVEDLALMTRQLGSLLSAGIPLVDALAALSDQVENPLLRTAVSTIREKVTEGVKLSDAMKQYPKIFDTLYVNMINAGESSGALETVLDRLGDFTESQSKLRAKISGAMTYPIIMMIVGGGLMLMLFTVVVPKITRIFIERDMPLPLPTKILITLSNGIIGYWYIVAAVVAIAVFMWKRWTKTPKGMEFRDRKMLKAPLFGKLTRQVAISRFSRTLSTLLASGVPMLAAMDIVRNVVGNVIIQQVVEQARVAVQEGASLSDTLQRSGEFPSLVIHMVSVGEKTGELEKMLERVADSYDTQVNNSISTLMSLLEPAMIMVMAVVVGFVVMGVLLPMLNMTKMAR